MSVWVIGHPANFISLSMWVRFPPPILLAGIAVGVLHCLENSDLKGSDGFDSLTRRFWPFSIMVLHYIGTVETLSSILIMASLIG